MSRILRRPMFRGGRVNSYGTGIASGLADGGRVGFRTGGSYLTLPDPVTNNPIGRTNATNTGITGISIADFFKPVTIGPTGFSDYRPGDRLRQAEREKFPMYDEFMEETESDDDESENENAPQKRAAIFIGPEYGTLGRADIVAAAREARDLQFDVLVCCAFNYDAHSSEIDRLADLPILKARMNPDLHMADELKNTGAGNLFVVFGEPDIDFINAEDGKMQVKINGVDVFHPSKGEVVSGGPESIAAWFIDTDYNEESFFVRHAYFLGANDPYKQLKSALKAEIDEEAWESLYRDISRPFPKPETGRIAVKVINHLGDEVMKVFNVE